MAEKETRRLIRLCWSPRATRIGRSSSSPPFCFTRCAVAGISSHSWTHSGVKFVWNCPARQAFIPVVPPQNPLNPSAFISPCLYRLVRRGHFPKQLCNTCDALSHRAASQLPGDVSIPGNRGTSLPGNGFAVDEARRRPFHDLETQICTVHAAKEQNV